jgi:hypothetical protein
MRASKANSYQLITPNQFQCVRQTAAVLMACALIAGLLPGFAAAQDRSTGEKRAAWIVPLDGPVLAGKPVTFRLKGNPSDPHWDLGDGATADGSSVTHTYQKPGVYRVVMGSKVGDTFNELSSAIVRVHTPETVHLPQVLLDTDARNEVDDQHYIAYALFSNLDVLGINSAHHGPHRIESLWRCPGADQLWRDSLHHRAQPHQRPVGASYRKPNSPGVPRCQSAVGGSRQWQLVGHAADPMRSQRSDSCGGSWRFARQSGVGPACRTMHQHRQRDSSGA